MKKLKREFVPREGRLQVLSNGGGTQSTCMIVLAANGVIPKPDIVIIADTEREFSPVWDYQEKYVKPLCKSAGMEYVRVPKSDFSDADLVYDGDEQSVLMPMFSSFNGTNADGRPAGKQPGFCSSHWKAKVIQRYLNARYGELELTRRGVDTWIGMSMEERRRVKYPSGKWQKRYPLFEAQVLRNQSIQIVKDFGFPEPPRSSCYMCPNRTDIEWLKMKRDNPADFHAACRVEQKIRDEFPWLTLHESGRPLGEVIFTTRPKQLDIYDQFCDTGMCFV